MAKYLITGGAGFIGRHLCAALLKKNHDIIILDNLSNSKKRIFPEKVSFVEGDIRDSDLLRGQLKKVEACFHLAAIPSVVMTAQEWRELHSINLDATLTVFQESILAGNKPVIYASSCAVYGNSEILPLHEALEIQPISAYGVDKLSGEMNARVAHHNFQLPTVGLRFFNVYGPHQNPNSPYSGVITRFIEGISQDKPIHIYGDGSQTRDFVYVEDIVQACIFAMENIARLDSQVYNVCRGESIRVDELANTIGSILNKKPSIQFEPARSYDVQDSRGSTEKAKKAGIICRYSLRQGLEKMLLEQEAE